MNSPSVLDYIQAHRKAILAAIGAVLVGIVDSATADAIIGGLDALLVLIVPNDEEAKAKVYRKRR
jgi:hypothetical protein